MKKRFFQRNGNIFAGKARKRWHSLTDEDVTVIDGNRNVLVNMLEEKYSYSKETS